MKPNTDKVICPNCVCQFRAITEDVQKLMLDAGFEPPFTTPPAQQEPIEEFAYKALTKRGEHCHFGTHTAARIWAGKGGKVETIKLRHLELVEQPAQRTWVGLTDEEIKQAWDETPKILNPHVYFYCLVEDKLKEKNT